MSDKPAIPMPQLNALVQIAAKPMPTIVPEDMPISMQAFLETLPPGSSKYVSDAQGELYNGSVTLSTPPIKLHCDSPTCGGALLVFNSASKAQLGIAITHNFLFYRCRNCGVTTKTYAIRSEIDEKRSKLTKLGEFPNFGPLTPARALRLIQEDRELFLKGRRCELQGLGVAAFTYYRRVIEQQRNRIFDEIIRVLETTHPDNDVIADLRAAKNQTQFIASVEAIKHALPSSLLINGRNPLVLLHNAFSKGVHTLTDDECLTLATAARTVLFEFSERLAEALKNDAALSDAVNLLGQPLK